ncbi:hypothetical protein A9Z42_0077400 [Trichoderma parareesei]|uniref:Uncharacterized protein n=1 Tax=Trichoderma parareesei TaxID=858221 RepID=A0A2H2ZUZ1_TRIPA|nr:hypothetical protein A9Z42_0077400 [Trichoderma parareesei]
MATAPIPIPAVRAAAAAPQRPPCAPATPGSWSWSCHKCRRRWPLYITKCLADNCGHVRCSLREGQPEHRRHCQVRFDTKGWQAHLDWRRQVVEEQPLPDAGAKMRDGTYRCEDDCSFPTECHEKRIAARMSLLALDSEPRVDDVSPSSSSFSSSFSYATGKERAKSAIRRMREHVYTPSPLNPAWRPEDIYM